MYAMSIFWQGDEWGMGGAGQASKSVSDMMCMLLRNAEHFWQGEGGVFRAGQANKLSDNMVIKCMQLMSDP